MLVHAHHLFGRTTSSASAAEGVLHIHAVEAGGDYCYNHNLLVSAHNVGSVGECRLGPEWTEVSGGPDHPHRHAVSARNSVSGLSVPLTEEEWAEVVAAHERWMEGGRR